MQYTAAVASAHECQVVYNHECVVFPGEFARKESVHREAHLHSDQKEVGVQHSGDDQNDRSALDDLVVRGIISDLSDSVPKSRVESDLHGHDDQAEAQTHQACNEGCGVVSYPAEKTPEADSHAHDRKDDGDNENPHDSLRMQRAAAQL